MANGKRGHRGKKNKKGPEDTASMESKDTFEEAEGDAKDVVKSPAVSTNETSEAIKGDAKNVVQVPAVSTNDTSEPVKDEAKDVVQVPADSTNDATGAMEPSRSTHNPDGKPPADASQKTNNYKAQLTDAHKKVFYYKLQLDEAHRKINDFEAMLYQQSDQLSEKDESGKKVISEHGAQIRARDGLIKQLQDAIATAKEATAATRKEVNEQKSLSQSLRDKYKDCQGRLASTSVELHNSNTAREALKDQLSSEKKETEQLRSRIAILMNEDQKREEVNAAVTESANTFMKASLDSQQDSTRTDNIIQAQKEEIQELKGQIKNLQSSSSRRIESEDGSDPGSSHHSQGRPQQPRMLSQELEGKLNNGEEEGDKNVPTLQGQSPAGIQYAVAEKGSDMLSQPLIHHSNSAKLHPEPKSGIPYYRPDFSPTVGLQNAPYWPERKFRHISLEQGYGRQEHKIWCTKDSPTQTDKPMTKDHETQTQQSPNQVKDLQLHVERGTQTDAPTDPTGKTSCYAESATQTDESTVPPENVSQANEPADKVEKSIQTNEPADEAEKSTQTDEPADKAEKSTQTDEPANKVENGTQTNESANKSKGQADVATQTEQHNTITRLHRLELQYWFFIIAACLLLLLAAFAFYQGIQARGERAMWLAANDYTRRAVVYHHSVSGRGHLLPWLTTSRMKDLSVRYGNGFGRYGVEM